MPNGAGQRQYRLAAFLQSTEPLQPLLDEAEREERPVADAKAAMRVWFAHSVGQPLAEAYQLNGVPQGTPSLAWTVRPRCPSDA